MRDKRTPKDVCGQARGQRAVKIISSWRAQSMKIANRKPIDIINIIARSHIAFNVHFFAATAQLRRKNA